MAQYNTLDCTEKQIARIVAIFRVFISRMKIRHTLDCICTGIVFIIKLQEIYNL